MKDHQGAWKPWAHLLYPTGEVRGNPGLICYTPTGTVHGNPGLVCCNMQVKFVKTLGLSVVPHSFRSQKPWARLL